MPEDLPCLRMEGHTAIHNFAPGAQGVLLIHHQNNTAQLRALTKEPYFLHDSTTLSSCNFQRRPNCTEALPKLSQSHSSGQYSRDSYTGKTTGMCDRFLWFQVVCCFSSCPALSPTRRGSRNLIFPTYTFRTSALDRTY